MYLISSNLKNHVSIETVHEFEEELRKFTNWKSKVAYPKYISKILIKVFRIHDLLNLIKTNNHYFFVLMHIESISERSFPFFYLNAKKKFVYLFDAWEPLIPKIINLMTIYNVNLIFVSAKQSAEIFNQKSKKIKTIWIPEGITLKNYWYNDYNNKDIDVIQIGRKFDLYHNKILKFCNQNQIKYIYEKIPGNVIFNNKNDFVNALSRSKISICFPLIITHPQRSGKVSTMTRRYLEAMASKCLIIGSMPEDMHLLFDYNPMIEADLENPENQLLDVLKNYFSYIPLIEKNYLEVMTKHQWKNRVEKIKEVIDLEIK